jgi:hypothetical protein
MNEKRVSGHSTLRPVHGAALHISSDLLPFCLAGVLISSDAGTFDLGVQRYRDAVGTLGTRVGKSEQASEARELVQEFTRGPGSALTRDGRVGARFVSLYLPDYLIWQKFLINQSPTFGSGGVIRNYNRPKYREIFLDSAR